MRIHTHYGVNVTFGILLCQPIISKNPFSIMPTTVFQFSSHVIFYPRVSCLGVLWLQSIVIKLEGGNFLCIYPKVSEFFHPWGNFLIPDVTFSITPDFFFQ